MRWKGNFFSSNSIGVVNPTEQVKNVIRNRETGHVDGGSQVKHVVKSFDKAPATAEAAGPGGN